MLYHLLTVAGNSRISAANSGRLNPILLQYTVCKSSDPFPAGHFSSRAFNKWLCSRNASGWFGSASANNGMPRRVQSCPAWTACSDTGTVVEGGRDSNRCKRSASKSSGNSCLSKGEKSSSAQARESSDRNT